MQASIDLTHDGQVQSQSEPEVPQEPHQEALIQDRDHDEGNGPQVLEEPEVREEAQSEHQPAVEEGYKECRVQLKCFSGNLTESILENK